MIRKTITITEEQSKWLDENHISLSSLVQDKIDEEMKKRNNGTRRGPQK